MSVSDVSGIAIPPGAAAWIDLVILVFVGLLILWAVLKVAGFLVRRSYNLTPAATAASRDIRPDFLTIDRAAQKEMIERGRVFDRTWPAALDKAVTATRIGVLASGVLSFASAAFLAFGRIEELDATWRNLSVQDRFLSIVESHPVGFALALAMIGAALGRLMMTVRPARQQG